jgi:hypothetical protein
MDRELLDYLDRRFEETKRHFGVVAEALEQKVQLVAEGVANLNEQFGRFREETSREFHETQAMIRFSYADLQRRLSVVEERLGLGT